MKPKDYLIVVLGPVPLLLIPLIGTLVSAEWNWTVSDFVGGWVLLAGATLVYRLLATQAGADMSYRAGAGLAVVAGLLLTWITLAVGIIGSEGNPVNALYFGVILVGLAGVGLSRFQAHKLARAAWVTAGLNFLVPVIAWVVRPGDFSPGVLPVFVLNGVFVALFAGAGLLFRRAEWDLTRTREAAKRG